MERKRQKDRRRAQSCINSSSGASTPATTQSSACSTHSTTQENQTPEKADAESGGISQIEWPETWQENVQQRSSGDEETGGHDREYFPMEDLLTSWTTDSSGPYRNAPIIETDKVPTAFTDRESLWVPLSDMIDFTIPVAHPNKNQASNMTTSNASGSSMPTSAPSATAHRGFQSHSRRQEIIPNLLSTDDRNSVQCDCLRLAACLLEDLGTTSTGADEVGIDGLLGCCRESLSGCHKALCCARCESRSESVMLLAMVAQAISALYEKLAKRVVRLVSQGDGEGSGNGPEAVHDPASQPLVSNSDSQGAVEIWLSNYRIDNKAERNQVILSLIMVQLAEFCQLLSQLKGRAGNREMHQAPLASAERRVRGIRPLLLSIVNYISWPR